MTPEVAPPAVVDLPEEWFERSQRAFFDIKSRLERRQRELDVRERELEARTRDLVAQGERLQETVRKADEASQHLMARTHRLHQDERGLGEARDEVAASRRDVEDRVSEVARREALLAEAERGLREREETLVRSEGQLEATRQEQLAALAAAREGGEAPGPVPTAKDLVLRLLELKGEFESALARLGSRETEARRRLAEAAARAGDVERLGMAIRAREDRLEGMRAEIVNARDALSAVDAALARMPYEVVDDFTRSEEFSAYEQALRALKRFDAAARRP